MFGNPMKVHLVRKSYVQREISAQTTLTLETPVRYKKTGPTFRLSKPRKSEASGPLEPIPMHRTERWTMR